MSYHVELNVLETISYSELSNWNWDSLGIPHTSWINYDNIDAIVRCFQWWFEILFARNETFEAKKHTDFRNIRINGRLLYFFKYFSIILVKYIKFSHNFRAGRQGIKLLSVPDVGHDFRTAPSGAVRRGYNVGVRPLTLSNPEPSSWPKR